MRTAAIIFLALIVSLSVRAADVGLTGRILDNVTCEKAASQSYALYLPSNYTAVKRWPVIFCFDPDARGRTPVERLQIAAEKYGYIVAGSLTSRNGSGNANAAAVQALIQDVAAHFPLDPKRIYTAGLSGGARVATQVALAGLAKGVIACSAGFPPSDEEIPFDLKFGFFGTTGTEDFNFPELKRLDHELDERKAPHRIVVFNGGHEWATPALLTEAVEWLEISAMRTGSRPRDPALIRSLLAARLSAIPTQPAVEEWRALKSLAADFKSLTDTGVYEKKVRELAGSIDVKIALKTERALERQETTMIADLDTFARQGSMTRRKKFADDLRLQAAAADDSAERRMARRTIAGFAVSIRESMRAGADPRGDANAADVLEMLTWLRPGQTRTLYELARARALEGDRKRALASLQLAAENGYADTDHVLAEPAFSKMKNEPAFEEIVRKIRANPAEPDRRSRERP